MKLEKTCIKVTLFAAVALIAGVYGKPVDKGDPFAGDWKAKHGAYFAQVYVTREGGYKVNLRKDLTSLAPPLAVLTGEVNADVLNLSGDGWTGKIEKGRLRVARGGDKIVMRPFHRTSPTMNAVPPEGAIVLFDGTSLDAWKKVVEKDWVEGKGGPADNWKILPGGAMEVVPHTGSIISRQRFGDLKLHLEFRLLGEVTNGGVYLMSRYEINIKDSYGQIGGSPACAFGNIAKPKNLYPDVNMAFPPLQWQTLDIDFRAPRFDGSGTEKIGNARISVVHNGVPLYKDVELEAVKGATSVLGEAGVGPIYLQEHGTAYQFRNIWVVDKTVKGTEHAHTTAAVTRKGGSRGGRKTGGAGAEGKKKGGKRKGGSGGKKTDASYEGEKNPAYASASVMTAADLSGMPARPAGFAHPGVLVSRGQLDKIRSLVNAGVEPQRSAFEMLKNSPLGALDYKAQPRDTISCGPHSKPNLGCKDEQADCAAAYSQALLWSITGNEAYAENAIEIMNAWSHTLRGGHNYANGPVQAAWCGSVWPRAAEIIRYTYSAWSDADIAKFQNMLRVQYLPSIIHGDCENGNKELAMAEALINIGVFNDDRATFEHGLKMWRGRTPAYIYLKSDGPKPIEPPGCGPAFWSNKGLMPELVDGLLQETARDSHHPWMGFASMANAAETAFQQGVDLYQEEGERMMAALEFQAQYLPPNNAPVPENLEFRLQPTWEIAYNHFHDRLGYSLPKMSKVIPTNRPTGVDHHMAWETLTHAGVGSTGLRPVEQESRKVSHK